jgi:hypothetical protein
MTGSGERHARSYPYVWRLGGALVLCLDGSHGSMLRIRSGTYVLGCMVAGHRTIRSLPHHSVSATIWRRHTLRISGIRQMRGSNLGATMMRSRGREGWLRSLHGRHPICTWNKGLSFGIKRVVPVITARNRVLTLWIKGVGVRRKLAKCIRNTRMSRWKRRRRCPAPALIARRVEGRLPCLRLSSSWHRRSI